MEGAEEEGAGCLSLILSQLLVIARGNPNPRASDLTSPGNRLRLGIDACFSMIQPNVMRRLLHIKSQASRH